MRRIHKTSMRSNRDFRHSMEEPQASHGFVWQRCLPSRISDPVMLLKDSTGRPP